VCEDCKDLVGAEDRSAIVGCRWGLSSLLGLERLILPHFLLNAAGWLMGRG